MKVSYNWLAEYIPEISDQKSVISVEEVAKVLNEKAFEVESIEKKSDDFILDIDVLPNRAHDCLCHKGIAKEIALNLGLEFSYKEAKEKTADFETEFKSKITDERCFRHLFREIRNVKIGPSHPDLKKKIEIKKRTFLEVKNEFMQRM